MRLAKRPADRRSTKVINEGNGEDWRFGNMRFPANRYGDSDDGRLRDHHRRGQYGYNRNCTAPHFYHFSERFDRPREDIADAALRLNHVRRTRIDLQFAPQPQDLDIDASIENILVNSGGLQQMLPRERPLRCFEKGQQQRIFAFAQRDRRRIAIEESPATPFKLPAIESVPASLRIMSTCNPPHFLPPQYRADAGKQFSEAEGFYDVVVGTEFETDDAIDFVGTMAGRDDHRNIRMRTNFPQQVQPIILTEPQIQNDQAGNGPSKMTIQLCSV